MPEMSQTARRLRALQSLTGTPPELVVDDLPGDPVAMFWRWLDEAVAAGIPEPHAATFVTADADGLPDARTLIVKDVDARGWAFAGTASSTKGQQLAANPRAALNLWWQPQVRAIRARGPVEVASPAECEADLAARSESARAQVADGDWRVWRIRPERVEFWQGATDRRHLRIIYTREAEGWAVEVRRQNS